MIDVPRSGRWGFWAFIVLMLGLMALFTGLGIWQVQRLAEKEQLIATVQARLDLTPVPLPPAAEWSGFDADVYNYRPLTVTGRYVPEASVLVFTSLSEARGKLAGPGYLVMTPLALQTGGTLLVNRGFVPQQSGPAFAGGGPVEQGPVTLTGIGRLTEEVGSFTPGPDTAKRIEWVRNVDRLAAMSDANLAPFAPITLDLPAGPAGALPQGGETVVEFPNNHLGYAMTWFGFATITPVLLFFWARRQRRIVTRTP